MGNGLAALETFSAKGKCRPHSAQQLDGAHGGGVRELKKKRRFVWVGVGPLQCSSVPVRSSYNGPLRNHFTGCASHLVSCASCEYARACLRIARANSPARVRVSLIHHALDCHDSCWNIEHTAFVVNRPFAITPPHIQHSTATAATVPPPSPIAPRLTCPQPHLPSTS